VVQLAGLVAGAVHRFGAGGRLHPHRLFPADALINTWQLTLLDLGWVKSGLSLRINATFAIGMLILLTVFAVQHGGILRSARLTLVLGSPR
jgi:hypothetical protein